MSCRTHLPLEGPSLHQARRFTIPMSINALIYSHIYLGPPFTGVILRGSDLHGDRRNSNIQVEKLETQSFSLEYAPEARKQHQQHPKRQVQWQRGKMESSDESATDIDMIDMEGINPELLELMSRHAKLEIPVIIQKRRNSVPNTALDAPKDPLAGPSGVQEASGQVSTASGSAASSRRTSANAAAPAAQPRSSRGGSAGGVRGCATESTANHSDGGSHGGGRVVSSGNVADRSPERMARGHGERQNQDRPWSPAGGSNAPIAVGSDPAIQQSKVGSAPTLIIYGEKEKAGLRVHSSHSSAWVRHSCLLFLISYSLSRRATRSKRTERIRPRGRQLPVSWWTGSRAMPIVPVRFTPGRRPPGPKP